MKKVLSVLVIFIFIASCNNVNNSNNELNNGDITITPTFELESSHDNNETLAPIIYRQSEVEPKRITTLGKGYISEISYSPDGTIFAFGDKEILRWYDANSLEELGNFPIADENENGYSDIVSIEFSPDGRLAIIDLYAYYGSGYIFDFELKQNIAKIRGEIVGPPVIGPNNKYAAFIGGNVTSGGPYYDIRVWDLEYDIESHRFPIISDDYSFLHEYFCKPAINPQGTIVASGSSENIAYVWDIESGEVIWHLQHASYVNSVDFSPDGQYLVTSSHDGLVRLWNIISGKLVKTLNRLDGDIDNVQYLTGKNEVKITYENENLSPVIWDITSDQISLAETTEDENNSFFEMLISQGYAVPGGGTIIFSPDNTIVAMGTENVMLWDVNSRELLDWLDNPSRSGIYGMAFSPNGCFIGAITSDNTVVIWDMESGQSWEATDKEQIPLGTVWAAFGGGGIGPARGTGSAGEFSLAFSPDSKKVVFANRTSFEIWDVDGGTQLDVVEIPKDWAVPTSFSFSEDGSKLYIIINRNRGAFIWDVDRKEFSKEIKFTPVDENAFTAIAHEGSLFARNNDAGEENWIELWNLDTETMLKLPVAEGNNEPFRFSPDGRILAAVTDRYFTFWSTDTGRKIFTTSKEYVPKPFVISSDSTQFARINGGKIEIYDISKIAEFPEVILPSASGNIGGSRPEVPGHEDEFPQEENGHEKVEITPTPTIKTPEDNFIEEKFSANFGLDSAVISDDAITINNADKVVQFSRFSNGRVMNAHWADNGESILVSSSQGVYQYRADFSEIYRFENETWMTDARISTSGDIISVGLFEESIQIWNISKGELIQTLNGSGQPAMDPTATSIVFEDEENKVFTGEIGSDKDFLRLDSEWYYSYVPKFSPNGEYIAAIQGDNSIRVWDAKTGQIVNGLGVKDGELHNVWFSADSQYVIGASGSYAYIWTVEPGNYPIEIQVIKDREPDPVPGTAISPDIMRTNSVTAAALSPDGNYLAAGTGTGIIYLYDLVNNTSPVTFKGHTSLLTDLEFHPSGNRLLSVDADGGLMVWSISGRRRFSSLDAFSGIYEGLIFRNDGNVAAWTENKAWVLSPQTSDVIHITRQYTGIIYAVSPDGQHLAVYNPIHMELWNLDGELVHAFPEEAEWTLGRIEDIEDYFSAEFSSDGSKLFSVGSGGFWVLDVASKELVSRESAGPYLEQIAVSPNGVLSASCSYPLNRCYYIVLDNIETSRKDYSPLPHVNLDTDFYETIVQFKFSPNGQYIAAVTYGWENPGRLVIWNFSESEEPVFTQTFSDSELSSLTFSPDGGLIAIGRGDGSIDLIDTSTWEVVRTLKEHKLAVDYLTFSPGGQYLVSAGEDGTIKIWGVSSN